jgi:hypothetical protein
MTLVAVSRRRARRPVTSQVDNSARSSSNVFLAVATPLHNQSLHACSGLRTAIMFCPLLYPVMNHAHISIVLLVCWPVWWLAAGESAQRTQHQGESLLDKAKHTIFPHSK